MRRCARGRGLGTTSGQNEDRGSPAAPSCRQLNFRLERGFPEFRCPRMLRQVIRHGKSLKHAGVAWGQFFRKLSTFVDKQRISDKFYPSMATSLHYLSSINLFLFKNIQCITKNCNLGHFYMIRKYVTLRTFLYLENWLGDKNHFFHVWAIRNMRRLCAQLKQTMLEYMK